MSDIQKNILAVYALIAVGSVMMMVPFSLFPFAGMACSFVGFASAYVYRWKHKDDALMSEHMTYIIRTVWWSSLILLVGMLIFCSIIMTNGDLSMIYNLMDSTQNGILPTDADVRAMQIAFVNTNMDYITLGAIIGLLPYPLCLAYRMVRGVRKITRA